MSTRPRPQQGAVLLILVLVILTPLLAAILGSLCVTPHRLDQGASSNLEHLPRGHEGRRAMASNLVLPDVGGVAVRPPGQASSAGAGYGFALLTLDPHDDLHLFALLPALAGLVMLAGAAVVWAILTRRRAASRPGGKMAWLQYGLLGVLVATLVAE